MSDSVVVSDVSTVAEFLAKYYRPERYTGRGAEYARRLLASHEVDYLKSGYDLISQHDSVTGRVMVFGTPPAWWGGTGKVSQPSIFQQGQDLPLLAFAEKEG